MISLAIPLYDEEDNVELVARELVEAFDASGIEYELLLVDNGSRDRTGELIDGLMKDHASLRKVVVETNLGFGWGVIQGLRAAKGELLGFMGGDRQIRAEDVIKVARMALTGEHDLSKVVRVERHDGFQRWMVTTIYNLLFRVMFGCGKRDINGTPKILKRELYEQFELTSKDWFIDAEVLLKALHCGNPNFGEVEVQFFEREKGSSHVRASAIVEFLKNMFRYRFKGKKAWKTPKS